MRSVASSHPTQVRSRSTVARERMAAAIRALAACRLCDWNCGADRSQEPAGRCHAGPRARVFSAQTEVSDELEFIPTFAIAFSGCDLRCAFCITGKESWNPVAGEPLDAGRLATRAVHALDQGARSIMILGGEPTVHLPSVLELIAELPEDARLIWKTNGHASAQARELLDGLLDVWLVDYKFGNDDCARRLARVEDYLASLHENLRWAAKHSELVVRHLLMPGHLKCCWEPVANRIARHHPGVKVNLRGGFWPAWQSGRHRELMGTVSDADIRRAVDLANELGLNLIS